VTSHSFLCHLLTDIVSVLLNGAPVGNLRYVCICGIICLEDVIAGDDFLGLYDQNSSYKHFSDFRRLQSYGRSKL